MTVAVPWPLGGGSIYCKMLPQPKGQGTVTKVQSKPIFSFESSDTKRYLGVDWLLDKNCFKANPK